MIEYGIFNNEGMVEGQFYSLAEANKALHTYYDLDDDELFVSEICSEHEEQEKDNCEECAEDLT